MTTTDTDRQAKNLKAAKGALERVCSGAGLDPPSRYYSSSFVDHVNDLEISGLEGAAKSVEVYKAVFSQLSIKVEDQAVDGDRVISRFVVQGTCYGRRVSFNGITISHFKDGLIIEDWSVTDTLGMLRQLGIWRSILLGLRQWRVLKQAASSSNGSARTHACSYTSGSHLRT